MKHVSRLAALSAVLCLVVAVTILVLPGCPRNKEAGNTEVGGANAVAARPGPATAAGNEATAPVSGNSVGGEAAAPSETASGGAPSGGGGAPSAQAPAGTPGQPGTSSRGAGAPKAKGQKGGKREPVQLTGDLATIAARRKAVTSLKIVSTGMGGPGGGNMTATTYIKQQDAQAVAIRSEMGTTGAWSLSFPQKREMYRYDPQKKEIKRFKFPEGGGFGGGGAKGGPGGGKGGPQGGPGGGKGGPGGGKGKGGFGGGGRGMGMRGGTGDLDMIARAGTPKITSEKVDGMDCWRIEVTGERGAMVSWMDKKYGLTRQFKLGDNPATKVSVQQVNAVPDSMFHLPEGVKVIDAAPGEMPFGGGMGGRGGPGGGKGGPGGGAKGGRGPGGPGGA